MGALKKLVPHRVDIEASDQHLVISAHGTVVAETRRPLLLHETGLPVRYYLPRDDVRMDLLEATDHHTRCPWKGQASYWSIRVGDALVENAVWCYEEPIPEAAQLAGLLAFYTERLDIQVDGRETTS